MAKRPTHIKIGNVTVIDRTGRSSTKEEYVRDLAGLAFPGMEMGSPRERAYAAVKELKRRGLPPTLEEWAEFVKKDE